MIRAITTWLLSMLLMAAALAQTAQTPTDGAVSYTHLTLPTSDLV